MLIVDRMGKDVSGTGLDTNVIGRRFNDHKALPDEEPKVKRIVVRSLTEATHGNAMGLGSVDFCPQRLIDQSDLEATRINAMTSLHLSAARLPFVHPTDRDAIAAALTTIGNAPPRQARLVWIRDTSQLGELECSESILPELTGRADIEIVSELRAMPFASDGSLQEAW